MGIHYEWLIICVRKRMMYDLIVTDIVYMDKREHVATSQSNTRTVEV